MTTMRLPTRRVWKISAVHVTAILSLFLTEAAGMHGVIFGWSESDSSGYSINGCGGLVWRTVEFKRCRFVVVVALLPLLLVVLFRGVSCGVWVASHGGGRQSLDS